ncbi:MAG: TonB-dependent receptor, partial [Cytophagaceae bacterium]|nr:TonB-dependent receptor [Cytophagaceae bacterium]
MENLTAIEGQPYINTLLANGYETVEDPLRPGKQLLFKDNNLQNALWNTAQLNNYTIGIDGGTERTAYNVSLGYVDQGGIFAGTGYKRFSGLGNFSFRVTDKFRIDLNSQYQFNKTGFVNDQFVILTRGSRLTPLVRTYYDNGLPAPGENLNTRTRLHELFYDDRRISTDRFTIRLAGDYVIIKGLHYRPAISLLTSNFRHLFQQEQFPGTIQPGDPGQKFNQVSDDKQFLTDQLLQYDFGIGRHSLTALVGFNYTRNVNYNFSATSSRASNNYVFTIAEPIVRNENGQVRANYLGVGSSLNEFRSSSYFGQVNYDFDGRYLLGVALRYDGFSNFAPNKKFAFFPSASAGWNIARETFWKVSQVNQLKLRAS